MTEPLQGRDEPHLTGIGLPFESNVAGSNSRQSHNTTEARPSPHVSKRNRSSSRRQSQRIIPSHVSLCAMPEVARSMQPSLNYENNAANDFSNKKLLSLTDDSDEKRLQSLSDRISNLKVQYKGILSSQARNDSSFSSVYGCKGAENFKTSLMNVSELKQEPHMQETLSLTLNNSSSSLPYISHLLPMDTHLVDNLSSYVNQYDQKSSINTALDMQYSTLTHKENINSHFISTSSIAKSELLATSYKSLAKSDNQKLPRKAVTSSDVGTPIQTCSLLHTVQPQLSSLSPNKPKTFGAMKSVPSITTDTFDNKKIGLLVSDNVQYKTDFNFHDNQDSITSKPSSNGAGHSENYFDYYNEKNTQNSNEVAQTEIVSYLSLTEGAGGFQNESADALLDPGGPNSISFVTSPYSPYFKEFVEDLGPEEYRWFYKNESDKKWIPFIGYDSLRIEWKFRDLQQNGVAGIPVNVANTEACIENECTDGNNIDAEERLFELGEEGTVTVRGGLYEVDVQQRKGQSIYWKGEVFVVCRGTWFYEGAWTPLEEALAFKLETEHLQHFRGHPLNVPGLVDSQKQVVRRLVVPEGSVEWFSASEVYLSLDATPARLMRSVGKKLGFQKTGYKVHRGYSLDASASDKPPDITHLVFVIHGIGQKMDTGRIIKNCTSLRDNVNSLKQRYLRDTTSSTLSSSDDASNTTVEFFPVEWRSLLTLDSGLIDSITPHKILNIRQMLNASFMDIMYYNSPQYREEIVTVLSSELNRLYSMFTERNPYFEATGGKVSVVSHSLGCVITYDIVTGWSPTPQLSTSFLQAMSGVLSAQQQQSSTAGSSSLQLQSALQQLLHNQLSQAEQPNLNFKITNLFCLGSPLAVFLALRWKRAAGAPPLLSRGRFQRILNIFHPSDPVAYRLEPLISSSFAGIAPITLHCHSAADKLPYHLMPLEPVTLPPSGGGESVGVETPTTSQPTTPVRSGSSSWNLWGLMKGGKKSSDPSQLQQQQQQTPSQSDAHNSPGGWGAGSGAGVPLDCIGHLSESQRIDYVLREGSMESSYISALTSHTSYWSNFDVAHFLLTTLYPHLQTCTGTTTSTTVAASAGSTFNAVVTSVSPASNGAKY